MVIVVHVSKSINIFKINVAFPPFGGVLSYKKTIMDFAGHNNLLLVEAYYLLLGENYYVVNMLEEISLHTIHVLAPSK